jgi:glycosyltransferase involved in cell wall biosynthesis
MAMPMSRNRTLKNACLRLPKVRRQLACSSLHLTSDQELRETNVTVAGLFHDVAGRDAYVIPNMIADEDVLSALASRSSDRSFIVYLGRIHPIKNVAALLDAFAACTLPPIVHLHIAGWSGECPEYTAELKDKVRRHALQERVTFTDRRVEGEEKRSLLRDAELVVLPSHSENFGMTVLEALGQGTPVIASTGTPWERLNRLDAGYWITPSQNDIARTITMHFNRSPVDREGMRGRALSLAGEFRRSALASQYVELYQHVIRKNRGAS